MALDLPSYLLGKKKGGGGGTSDYSQLTNKPSINGVTLSGNKTGADLGLLSGDYDLRVITVRSTPTQEELSKVSDIINYLYNIYANNGQITNNLLIYVSFITTTTNGEIYSASLFITKYPDRFYVVHKNTELEFKGQPVGYPYTADTTDFNITRKIKVTGTWTNNVFTATGITPQTESNYYGAFLATNNNKSYTPTSNYHPATKKYVDDSVSVVSGDS